MAGNINGLDRNRTEFGSRAHRTKTIMAFYDDRPLHNRYKGCFTLSSLEPLLYPSLSVHVVENGTARRL